jgi:tetratricopeptide (TPR) repeat protein
MIGSVLVLILAASGAAPAQQPAPYRPLCLSGNCDDATKAPTAADPVTFYRDRHEAALAAFQAGYKAMTIERNRPRAIRLFLLALKREPHLAKALYNLGILCVAEERWGEALSFYQAARQDAGEDADLAKLAAEELTRVELVGKLESTPAGSTQRKYDAKLLPLAALKATGDPITLLDEASALSKLDPSRWEAPALIGVLQARIGRYAESTDSLNQAANAPSAPRSRQAQIKEAAELASREATYLEKVRDPVKGADAKWEKHQYDEAAKLYEEAWEASPGHLDAAMEAVTGFLLADDVDLAVLLLESLRDAGSPEVGKKAVAMLDKLGAISGDAKLAAARAPSAPASKVADVADRIDGLVATLTTPQMELEAKPDPPLLSDKAFVTLITQDVDVTGPGSILSTEKVFELYQRSLPSAAPPPVPAGQPPAPPGELPAATGEPPPAAAPATERPAPPRGAPGPSGSAAPASQGPSRTVTVTSTPAGAAVVFDSDSALSCKTPCNLPLSAERHTYVATLPGYRDWLGIVDAGRKSDPINLDLEARSGQLMIVSNTPGAHFPIFLNGKSTGQQTPFKFTLDEGEYDIGVEIEGQMVVQTKVPVKGNDIQTLRF